MPQADQLQLKYFIYARKSTERDERQAHSIPDQLDTVRRLAEERGLAVVEEFAESRTARKPGRPVFQEMLEPEIEFAESALGLDSALRAPRGARR